MSKLITSKDANPNYLAKLVKIEDADFRKHESADRLKCVTIDFQNVITGIGAPSDYYVYFPVECQIAHEILSNTNSYRDSELNVDKEKSGFFEKNRRVKAVKLRNVASQGYILPAPQVFEALGFNWKDVDEMAKVAYRQDNNYFDYIGKKQVCQKYEIPEKDNGLGGKKKQSKKLSRLVDGQVYLHVATENLRRNIQKIPLNALVSVSYKEHGCSGTAQHVLVNKPQNWAQKALTKLKLSKKETEYDLVYTSRRVVKNEHFNPKGGNDFYDYDIWEDMVNKYDLKNKIPKGYSLYYEIVGYTKTGGYIQKGYDYGCEPKEAKIRVYRVTATNPDGMVYNLNTLEAKQFTERIGLEFVDVLFHGTLRELYEEMPVVKDEELNDIEIKSELIGLLEEQYNEKDCYICKNSGIPEEGIVLRVEKFDTFEAYKLKSARFLEHESKQLDEDAATT